MLRSAAKTAGIVASVPLVCAAAAVVVKPDNKGADQKIYRPSELPLYEPVYPEKCSGCKAHADQKPTGATGVIQDGVQVVRENMTHVYNVAQTHTHQLDDYYQTGKEHSRVFIDYLNEPGNSLPRAGAIALGGASGFVLGLRHGAIRRLLYTGTGAAALASICYPNDAKVYANRALGEAKGVAKIGYNFAYGVKPGDEPNYPKLPTSGAELLDAVCDLYTATKNKISSATITTPGDQKSKSTCSRRTDKHKLIVDRAGHVIVEYE